jgi:hypothetical protein
MLVPLLNCQHKAPQYRAAIADYPKSVPPVEGSPRPRKVVKGGGKS